MNYRGGFANECQRATKGEKQSGTQSARVINGNRSQSAITQKLDPLIFATNNTLLKDKQKSANRRKKTHAFLQCCVVFLLRRYGLFLGWKSGIS